jgi:hypothetical protein
MSAAPGETTPRRKRVVVYADHPPPDVPPLLGAVWCRRTGAWLALWRDGSRRITRRCDSQEAAHALAVAHGAGSVRPGPKPVPLSARSLPGGYDIPRTHEEFRAACVAIRRGLGRGDEPVPKPRRQITLSAEDVRARLGLEVGRTLAGVPVVSSTASHARYDWRAVRKWLRAKIAAGDRPLGLTSMDEVIE